MNFTKAFDLSILHQKIIGCSFQQPTLVKLISEYQRLINIKVLNTFLIKDNLIYDESA